MRERERGKGKDGDGDRRIERGTDVKTERMRE